MDDRSRIMLGAALGAACGVAAAYLFFTDRGRSLRDRIEPAVDDLRQEFIRFPSTIVKVGDLANEGLRAVSDFKAAHGQYPPSGTSH